MGLAVAGSRFGAPGRGAFAVRPRLLRRRVAAGSGRGRIRARAPAAYASRRPGMPCAVPPLRGRSPGGRSFVGAPPDGQAARRRVRRATYPVSPPSATHSGE